MAELLEKIRGSSTLFIDRDIKSSKQEFGVVLYDQVDAMFEKNKQSFLSTEDDLLIVTVRPTLLKTQREVAALLLKLNKTKQNLEQADGTDQEASSKKWRGKLKKAASKTQLFSIEQQLHHFKGEFGVNLFDKFVELEETKNWVPADPLIRSAYEQCRQTVEILEAKKNAKPKEGTTTPREQGEETADSNNEVSPAEDLPEPRIAIDASPPEDVEEESEVTEGPTRQTEETEPSTTKSDAIKEPVSTTEASVEPADASTTKSEATEEEPVSTAEDSMEPADEAATDESPESPTGETGESVETDPMKEPPARDTEEEPSARDTEEAEPTTTPDAIEETIATGVESATEPADDTAAVCTEPSSRETEEAESSSSHAVDEQITSAEAEPVTDSKGDETEKDLEREGSENPSSDLSTEPDCAPESEGPVLDESKENSQLDEAPEVTVSLDAAPSDPETEPTASPRETEPETREVTTEEPSESEDAQPLEASLTESIHDSENETETAEGERKEHITEVVKESVTDTATAELATSTETSHAEEAKVETLEECIAASEIESDSAKRIESVQTEANDEMDSKETPLASQDVLCTDSGTKHAEQASDEQEMVNDVASDSKPTDAAKKDTRKSKAKSGNEKKVSKPFIPHISPTEKETVVLRKAEQIKRELTPAELEEVELRKAEQIKNEYEWTKPEWTSDAVLSPIKRPIPEEKPRELTPSELEEVELRKAELIKNEYSWEKPEWAEQAPLRSPVKVKERTIEKKEPAREEVELRKAEQVKKEYEWEKPEWAKKVVLKSTKKKDEESSPQNDD